MEPHTHLPLLASKSCIVSSSALVIKSSPLSSKLKLVNCFPSSQCFLNTLAGLNERCKTVRSAPRNAAVGTVEAYHDVVRESRRGGHLCRRRAARGRRARCRLHRTRLCRSRRVRAVQEEQPAPERLAGFHLSFNPSRQSVSCRCLRARERDPRRSDYSRRATARSCPTNSPQISSLAILISRNKGTDSIANSSNPRTLIV